MKFSNRFENSFFLKSTSEKFSENFRSENFQIFFDLKISTFFLKKVTQKCFFHEKSCFGYQKIDFSNFSKIFENSENSRKFQFWGGIFAIFATFRRSRLCLAKVFLPGEVQQL